MTTTLVHRKLRTAYIGWERRYWSILVSKVGVSPIPLPIDAYAPLAGTSKMALDVLTGVASEYLLNVGRTIQFLSDKYGKKMSPEVGLE